MIMHCLNSMSETSQDFEAHLKEAVQKLATNIEARIQPAFDIFKTTNYELAEQDFIGDFNNPFVVNSINYLKNETAPIKPCLAENVFDIFLTMLVRKIAERLESYVLEKSFTFWGGLQLDKDI